MLPRMYPGFPPMRLSSLVLLVAAVALFCIPGPLFNHKNKLRRKIVTRRERLRKQMSHCKGADWSSFGRFHCVAGLFGGGGVALLLIMNAHWLSLLSQLIAGCGNTFTSILTALEQRRVADIHEQRRPQRGNASRTRKSIAELRFRRHRWSSYFSNMFKEDACPVMWKGRRAEYHKDNKNVEESLLQWRRYSETFSFALIHGKC